MFVLFATTFGSCVLLILDENERRVFRETPRCPIFQNNPYLRIAFVYFRDAERILLFSV